MTGHKRYSILIMGLALVLVSLVVACTKEPEAPYAPDFTLETVDGEAITLSDFRGKPVMLTFWEINCPACVFQMPYIQAFYDAWSGEKVAVLTINIGQAAGVVQDFITSRGFTFPVLLDLQGRVAQAYGLPGVPVTFLIDTEGVVKAYKIGPFQGREQIESAFEEVFPSLIMTPEPEVGPEVGMRAPDFTLQTIDGESVTLSDFGGRVVLLNFWLLSCQTCVDELPYLQTVSDEWPVDKLVVLAINVGDTAITVRNLVDSLDLTFPILLDSSGEVCTDYRRGCPTTFFIDDKGIIKIIKDGVFQSSDEIAGMLDSF